MEYCWVLPDNSTIYRTSDANQFYERNIKEAITAESYGFGSTLISSTPEALDPWILATKIAGYTQRIRLVVAQNTNHMLPSYTAKAANTLNFISGNRVDINVVTGSGVSGLRKNARFEDHEKRYLRTSEYMEVLQRIFSGNCSYKGKFYELSNAMVFPPNDGEWCTRLFVAGSSNEAALIAAKFGDVNLMYADDLTNIQLKMNHIHELSQLHNRNIGLGIYVNIITRETSQEAWSEVNQIISTISESNKKLVRLFYSNSDSEGISRNREFLENPISDGPIWSGFAKYSTTVSLSLVGSYKEVITAIKKYQSLGVKYFLFVSPGSTADIIRIGTKILPFI